MTRAPASRDAAHFDRLYARNDDPWGFRTSDYERAKYDATVSALGARRFASGLEVGCSIGELTARLAPLCDRLLGVDISEAPLRAASARNAATPQVAFARMAVPEEWPEGTFDLIVLSELLYFLTGDDIRSLAARCLGALRPGGLVLLVTWTETGDDPTDGDAAAALFIEACADRLAPTLQSRAPRYRLDLLEGVRDTA